jgi:polyketide cyclase/dehydrase/lipid transport protein
MLHATQIVTIDAPVDTIWQLISDFGTGSQYLTLVTCCTVQGTGIGALRTLTYLDGSIVIERLETVDKTTYHLSYALLIDTPFTNCLTTMVLRDLSPGKAELTWSVTFQPGGLPENEALPLMEDMLTAKLPRAEAVVR